LGEKISAENNQKNQNPVKGDGSEKRLAIPLLNERDLREDAWTGVLIHDVATIRVLGFPGFPERLDNQADFCISGAPYGVDYRNYGHPADFFVGSEEDGVLWAFGDFF
jgi:hypothetical protein